MFIFCTRQIASIGSRCARYVVRSRIAIVITALTVIVVHVLSTYYTDLPRVLSMPERLYLPRGLVGRIDCPVQSNPPRTVVVWSKEGRMLDYQTVQHAKVNKYGTLILHPVISSDEGQYSCTPYSPLGAGRTSAPVRVFVRGEYSLVARQP